MQTPQAPPLVRKPAVKLRPFFWNKLPWKPDHIWARVPAGRIARPELITSGHWQTPSTSPVLNAQRLRVW